jgi:peptide/nickel transport system ATP-binding protein
MVFRGLTIFGVYRKPDPEYLLTWMGALFALMDPVRKLAKVSMRFQASEAAATRVFELMDTPQEKAVHNAPTLARHRESIEFRGVNFRYSPDADDVLREINLSIRAGQNVAIVGPNGCGKTTLLSLVPRLIDPTAGQVLIDGQDVSKSSVRSLRRQIGLVTQDTILFEATIAENIAYGLRRPKREHVLEAARQAFVDEFIRDTARFPLGYETMVGQHGATLSGGQKQRIAIARAFAGDPTLVVCDEPASALDVSVQASILNLLVELQASEAVSYIFISHDLAVVRYISDRIGVMYLAELIEVGLAAEVFSPPHHPYTEALLSSIPTLDFESPRERISLRGTMPSLSEPPTGCRFHTRCHRFLGNLCVEQEPPVQEAAPGHTYKCHIAPDELLAAQSSMEPMAPVEA